MVRKFAPFVLIIRIMIVLKEKQVFPCWMIYELERLMKTRSSQGLIIYKHVGVTMCQAKITSKAYNYKGVGASMEC